MNIFNKIVHSINIKSEKEYINSEINATSGCSEYISLKEILDEISK